MKYGSLVYFSFVSEVRGTTSTNLIFTARNLNTSRSVLFLPTTVLVRRRMELIEISACWSAIAGSAL